MFAIKSPSDNITKRTFIYICDTMRTRDDKKVLAIRQRAIEMVVKEGFDGLSMQKLAKAANVSPATIYIYFKDREDLILELYEEANQKMMETTLEGFDPEMPFAEGLRVQWKNRAAFFLENRLELQFMEQIKHSPFYEKAVLKQSTVFKEKMGAFVRNAIERKELAPLPFEAYWSIAYAPLYQLIKYHHLGKNHMNEPFVLNDAIMDKTLELVLKALKP